MNKAYTAHEMREMANREKFKCSFVTMTLNGGILLNCTSDVRAMLLQAADLMEREKKYEYAVEHHDLFGKWVVYEDGLTLVEAQKLSREKWARPHRIVRREVSGWEEVREDVK